MSASSALAITRILDDPRIWRGDSLAQGTPRCSSTGFAALDRELPGGGWPAGALSELVCVQPGAGVFSLLLPFLRQQVADGREILLIDPPALPYAPAWAAAGIELVKLGWVTPATEQEKLWAMEQALREAGCVVLGWHRGPLHDRSARRLQLAADSGGSSHFLIRLHENAALQSPLSLRLQLAPAADGLRVDILKRRGRPLTTPLLLPLAAAARSHIDGPAGDLPSPAQPRPDLPTPDRESARHALSGTVFPPPGAGARLAVVRT